jgi:hypothetical protein
MVGISFWYNEGKGGALPCFSVATINETQGNKGSVLSFPLRISVSAMSPRKKICA